MTNINNPNNIGELWNDIGKVLTVIIIFNLLSYIVDDYDIFNESMLKSILYIIVGLILYHLYFSTFIIKKVDKKID